MSNTLDEELRRSQEDYQTGALANPLAKLSYERLRHLGRTFAEDHNLGEKYYEAFSKGAVLARKPGIPHGWTLTTEDREALQREGVASLRRAWKQLPFKMRTLIVTCGLGAATQGWNETAVNGANIFYKTALHLDGDQNKLLYGLVNAAPYAACAVFTYWLTPVFNARWGRKGAIIITSAISSASCLLQACSTSWGMLLGFRLLLGIGIGVKSAVIPIYAAECVPAPIRGTIVMLWQVCTAAGILLGLICGIMFYNAGVHRYPDLNWRLMVGSPMILPLLVIFLLQWCPESPRWYIKKDRYKDAFQSLIKLRQTPIQAARDLFYIHCLIVVERRLEADQRVDHFVELFSQRRNYRAMLASGLVMFLQQQCGINILIYYSSEIILQATNDYQKALAASIGVGAINVVFALPAFYWIDSKGRRYLLLATFPWMAVAMLWTSQAFRVHDTDAKVGLVLSGMYLFTAFYSFGEGPVPFTYSAECHALYIRERAMSVAVAITWAFNFILSFSWPKMEKKWQVEGALLWYMAWNIIGFFLILFFVPETKNRTLEELDRVFSGSEKELISYACEQVIYFFGHTLLRKNMKKPVHRGEEKRREAHRRLNEPDPIAHDDLPESAGTEIEMGGILPA
ncbi:hypothetical protein K440DRAFT_593060 [Wilcoxina mikolae CBS 423.85]|nr:hypothetical protein K440DRAFT_593060 [Wilcoxina mikolae CBS 423.85]